VSVIVRLLLALVLLSAANPLLAQFDIVERTFDADENLISALRKGGFVLYLRHGVTERAQPDREHIDFDDCSTQRNLSEPGRDQVREIGVAFNSLGIPINKVFSSPFCRCMETAELAFGDYQVVDELGFSINATSQETVRMADVLRSMLSIKPQKGNTVLVSHTANLKEATGIWPKPEAVIELFRPTAENGVEYYGKLLPQDWHRLLRTLN